VKASPARHWPPLQATASFGLALLDPDVTVEASIERADQALLLAKTAGRNRAINWDASVATGTQLRRLEMTAVAGPAEGPDPSGFRGPRNFRRS
jgi:predicted signal transduction protein with EAL and GGDEF domain